MNSPNRSTTVAVVNVCVYVCVAVIAFHVGGGSTFPSAISFQTTFAIVIQNLAKHDNVVEYTKKC